MEFQTDFTPDGKAVTPWGTYDVRTAEGVVALGLGQLNWFKQEKMKNGEKITDKLLEDIAAYEWVIANKKQEEYFKQKEKMSNPGIPPYATPVRLVAYEMGWKQ